jgi:D-ribose pyranase
LCLGLLIKKDVKMKTHGILHNELAKQVARLGHGDMIVIADRGFPFPRHDQTVCIDLSIGRGIPKVADVVKIVLEELEIERVIIADETKTVSPKVYDEFKAILATKKNKGNDILIKNIPHPDFKHLVLNGSLEGQEMKVFVKCGQFTPYANIILISGVDF